MSFMSIHPSTPPPLDDTAGLDDSGWGDSDDFGGFASAPVTNKSVDKNENKNTSETDNVCNEKEANLKTDTIRSFPPTKSKPVGISVDDNDTSNTEEMDHNSNSGSSVEGENNSDSRTTDTNSKEREDSCYVENSAGSSTELSSQAEHNNDNIPGNMPNVNNNETNAADSTNTNVKKEPPQNLLVSSSVNPGVPCDDSDRELSPETVRIEKKSSISKPDTQETVSQSSVTDSGLFSDTSPAMRSEDYPDFTDNKVHDDFGEFGEFQNDSSDKSNEDSVIEKSDSEQQDKKLNKDDKTLMHDKCEKESSQNEPLESTGAISVNNEISNVELESPDSFDGPVKLRGSTSEEPEPLEFKPSSFNEDDQFPEEDDEWNYDSVLDEGESTKDVETKNIPTVSSSGDIHKYTEADDEFGDFAAQGDEQSWSAFDKGDKDGGGDWAAFDSTPTAADGDAGDDWAAFSEPAPVSKGKTVTVPQLGSDLCIAACKILF